MMPMALFYKWFGSSPTGHRRSFLRAADLPPMLRDVPPAAALCRVFAMAQASSHSRTTNWFAHAGCSLILAGCRLQHRSHSLWNDVPGHSGFLHSLLHVEVHRCRAHLRHSSRWAWRCWTHGWQMTCWCEALRNQLWKALLICECSRVRGLAWQYVPQFPIAISSPRFSQARSRGICLLLLWCHVPWQSIRWSNRSENYWALKLQNFENFIAMVTMVACFGLTGAFVECGVPHHMTQVRRLADLRWRFQGALHSDRGVVCTLQCLEYPWMTCTPFFSHAMLEMCNVAISHCKSSSRFLHFIRSSEETTIFISTMRRMTLTMIPILTIILIYRCYDVMLIIFLKI